VTKFDAARFLVDHQIRFNVQRVDNGGMWLVVMQRGIEAPPLSASKRLSFYMHRKHQPDIYEIMPFLANTSKGNATALATQIDKFFDTAEVSTIRNAYYW